MSVLHRMGLRLNALFSRRASDSREIGEMRTEGYNVNDITSPTRVESARNHVMGGDPGNSTSSIGSNVGGNGNGNGPNVSLISIEERDGEWDDEKSKELKLKIERFKDASNTSIDCSLKDGRMKTQNSSSSSLASLSKKRASRATVSPFRRWPHATACALAIMVSLMGYSILQERIMTRPYTSPASHIIATNVDPLALHDGFGVDGANSTGRAGGTRLLANGEAQLRLDAPAYFHNSLFLVLANRLFAAAVAVICILARRARSDLSSKAAFAEYASVSLSNVIATSCQYEALKWLTFPTVTIGKCAKMLPVMLILNLRSGKRYSYNDYGVVAVVLAGCAVMISAGNVVAHRAAAADSDTPVGFVLLITYLLFDAITSTYQERLFAKYDMSVYNQMLYINVTSAFISMAGLSLSGGLLNSMRFAMEYPAIVGDITMLSLSAVAGQFAITYTIQAFGALLYAGIMTTRQFCSVLASDIIFKHGLTAMQWLGALMVFSALFYKLYLKAVQSAE